MTEDQIKAIAEEYVNLHCPSDEEEYIRKHLIQIAMHHYNFLNDRYCIVEREKVMEAYRDNLQKENETHRQGFDDYIYTYRNEQLTDLFGTSMFNQKEE